MQASLFTEVQCSHVLDEFGSSPHCYNREEYLCNISDPRRRLVINKYFVYSYGYVSAIKIIKELHLRGLAILIIVA